MASSTFFSLLLLIFVYSFYMDEALGAQTEIRKLKEMMKMRKNLEGNDERSSKVFAAPSITKHCKKPASFKNMKTSYRHVIKGRDSRDSSSLCSSCNGFPCYPCDSSPGSYCYTYSCSYSRSCYQFQGSPMTCTTTETCRRSFG